MYNQSFRNGLLRAEW